MTSPATAQAIPAPYPAPTKTITSTISSIPTTIIRILFADKILLTISQNGRLNQWIHVPLSTSSSTLSADTTLSGPSFYSYDEDEDEAEERPDSSLLPASNLTATTILGGTKPEFEVLGQTLATTLASAVLVKRPEEQRLLVLGLGLQSADLGKAGFEEIVAGCLDVL